MKFKDKIEAFNYYNTKTLAEVEKRAEEIKKEIETDANVDIDSLNIELDGLKEVKENMENKQEEVRGFNPVTGANFENKAEIKGDVYASAEYRNAFYKSLMGKELTEVETRALNKALEMEKRADAYTTSGNTPVVIPTTTLNEIISKARNMGGVISIARAFNMPTKIAIPVATPSDKAQWNTEGTAVESEKPTIASVTFDAYEIIKVFSISAKVRTMSIDAFESYLADELYKCVYECIADALINGTGSGQGTGVLNGVTWVTSGTGQNAIEVASNKDIAYADVVNAVALLKRGYNRGAKWVMNNATLYKAFYGMVDDNKKPIFIADPKTDNIGKILGFDVVVDDYLDDNVILFGNFDYLGYNLANGIAVESSTQSSFKSGRVDYRGMAIADTKVIVPEAFIKISKASATPSA